MEVKVWTTREGKEIPYSDLRLDHIYNIIKYAKNSGFFDVKVYRSNVDNSEDTVISYDRSYDVIRDMKKELKRRGILNVYYIKEVIDGIFKRVTPIFGSLDELQIYSTRNSIKGLIIKEYYGSI